MAFLGGRLCLAWGALFRDFRSGCGVIASIVGPVVAAQIPKHQKQQIVPPAYGN